jgi:hypothetical protein
MMVLKKQTQGRFGKIVNIFLLCVVSALAWSARAQANIDTQKLYKKAFPGSKPKCLFCHVDKLPKKDEGAHDLNAYGLKVKGDNEEVTVEAIQAAGESPADAAQEAAEIPADILE